MTDDTAAPLIRPMTDADVPACVEVFYVALDELYARNNQPRMPRNPDPLAGLFRHLLSTDPERGWLAEQHGKVAGFGIAHRRDDAWYLAFLFIDPAAQGAGLGRALVRSCIARDLDGSGPPLTRRAVCAEAIQPISVGLYASLGMIPRTPIFLVTGSPRDRSPFAESAGVDPQLRTVPFAELAGLDHEALARQIDGIDRQILGYAHAQDHRFLLGMGRAGHLFLEAHGSAVRGYGYAHTSGRIGPVALLEPAWLPEALDHLTGLIPAAEALMVWVPGPSGVLAPLLQRGLRMDGSPALYQSTDSAISFDRYLLGNFAML